MILAGTAGVGGIVVGYFLRWLVTLGQKGSIELTIKQTLLEAKDKAQQIVADAEKEATQVMAEAREKEREKEASLKKLEDRLLTKDETLDKRQGDIDSEVENLNKGRRNPTNQRKDWFCSGGTKAELARIAVCLKEAVQEIISRVEKEYEEDLVVRMHKFEMNAEENWKIEPRIYWPPPFND